MRLNGQVVAKCRDTPRLVAAIEGLQLSSTSLIAAHLDDGDYVIRIQLDGGHASIRINSVFREEGECGGTWWTTGTAEATGTSDDELIQNVVSAVLAEMRMLLEHFTSALADAQRGAHQNGVNHR